MCFANTSPGGVYQTTMKGVGIPSEPQLVWDSNNRRDGSTISRQIGDSADALGAEERGILDLEIRGDALEGTLGELVEHPLWVAISERSWDFQTWRMANDSMHRRSRALYQRANVHSSHATVFQSVLLTTRNPALALQAFITRLAQMSYYELLRVHDFEHEVTTRSTQEAFVPNRWHGLGCVLAMVAVHLVLVVSAVVLFARRTSDSALGNSWQVVAQMMSPDTVDVTSVAHELTDREVKRHVVSAGRSTAVCVVSASRVRERPGAQGTEFPKA